MHRAFLAPASAFLIIGASCAFNPSAGPGAVVPVLPFDGSNLTSDVERLAFLIYSHDIAAWRATDQAAGHGFDLKSEGVAGWITIPTGPQEILVRFIADRPSNPLALLDVDLDLSAPTPGVVTQHSAGIPLSQGQRSMWRARQLAMRSDFKKCPNAYNTVVLQDPKSSNWLVYLLAASETGEIAV